MKNQHAQIFPLSPEGLCYLIYFFLIGKTPVLFIKINFFMWTTLKEGSDHLDSVTIFLSHRVFLINLMFQLF